MQTDLIVIFDWDNTLCNTRNAVHKGLDDTMKHFGFPPVTNEDIINVMTRHRGAFWQSKFPLEEQEGKTSLPQAIEFYVSAYRLYTKETALFPEALPFILWLKEKNIPMVILSNKNHEALIEEVKDKQVFDYFEIVQGTKGPLGKPEKEFAEPILNKLNPKKIIFIGDGQSDMLMAKNLGALSILVHHKDEEVPFDYYCDTLKEAQTLVQNLL
ncbi:MAG: HAD family hydrolase [Alphaproteobacteria bacterium]|nr:HAD family hydrolase [Alphaproteobacteria bacterium]